MKHAFFSAALLSAAITFAPGAFAGAMGDMQVQKEKTVTLGNGKTMKVTIVKMQGQMMVVVPLADLESLLSRAEGHSMSISN